MLIPWSITNPQTYQGFSQFGTRKIRTNCKSDYTVTFYRQPSVTVLKKNYQVRTGIINTEYKARKKAGLLIQPLSATLYRKVSTYSEGFAFQENDQYGCNLYKAQYSVNPAEITANVVMPDGVSPYNDAYQGLLQRVRSEHARILETIMESRETAHELGNIVDKLSTSFTDRSNQFQRKVLRSKLKNLSGLKLARVASEFWLEWSFGIKPLLGDAHDIAEALAEIAVHRDRWVRVNGFGVAQNVTTDRGPGALVPPPGYSGSIQTEFTQVNRATRVMKMGGTIAPYNDIPYQLLVAGLTPDRVLPAVWELVPYSWLIDYLSNVGDMITTLTTGRLDVFMPWAMTFTKSEAERTHKPISASTTRYGGTGWKTTVEEVSWGRGPEAYIRFPSFHFKPYERLTQYVNTAAVAVQNIGARTLNSVRYSKKEDVVRFINHWR